MVTFSTQLVLKNTIPFISVPSRLQAFSVSFILFYFFKMLNPHRPSSAMRNLALFKEPAL